MSLGLALGAGLGSGVAQIGVLMALHRRGGPSGAVAGTAIGAFAAVCQAADRLDVLEDIVRSARLRTVLRYLDPHFRRGAMLGGRTIARQLDRHLGHASFEQLALPCAVVAADLVTDIGRASCRERVCTYVSISVDAVSIKKKTKYNYTQSLI